MSTSASERKATRTWPVLLLTLPAFVAIWGGWVGLGGMTGFGVINLLPGMVDNGGWSTVNTAATLPIGLETYAAYALHAYMNAYGPELKKFAGRSAIAALVLGGGGQLAYHVMESFGIIRAPWWITAIVATIPVAVLGAGTNLAALIRKDNREHEVPIEVLTEVPTETPETPNYVVGQDGESVVTEAEFITRKSRTSKPVLEKAVRLMLDGRTDEAIQLTSLSTIRLYQKVMRTLRDDPLADIDPKVDGRTVRPELVSIIRDVMNRERAL